MSKVEIKLNSAGIQELLKGGAMQSILREACAQKAQQAGEGYASAVHVHQKRAVGYVYPETAEAAHDNYENNTLLKVVG